MTKEEALQLVEDNGFQLRHLPNEFRKDEEIVLQAIYMGVRQVGVLADEYFFNGDYEMPFFYADKTLKNSRDFVLKAVALNGSSIKYASEEFKKDKEIVLKAVSSPQLLFAYTFADPSLQNDREVVIAAIKNDGTLWKSLPDIFKKDKEILLLAIEAWGDNFDGVDENLFNDPDVQKAFDKRFDEKHGTH